MSEDQVKVTDSIDQRHPASIVMLDLKGSTGNETSIFRRFLPEVEKIFLDAGRDVPLKPLDANTWGDAIIAVFALPLDAARFALRVRSLIREEVVEGLSAIQVRIAIHTGWLHKGTDHVRKMGCAESHYYGTDIVVPARIEPKITPDCIWITEQTKTLLEPEVGKTLKAKLSKKAMTITLNKNAGVRKVWALLGPRDTEAKAKKARSESEGHADESSVAAVRLWKSMSQALSLRQMTQEISRFRVRCRKLTTDSDLIREFRDVHIGLLRALRLSTRFDAGAGSFKETAVYEADVLRLEGNGALVLDCVSTNHMLQPGHVPKMSIEFDESTSKFLSPPLGAGVAAACLFHSQTRPGVAVAPDIAKSSEAVFFERIQRQRDEEGLGSYRAHKLGKMYAPLTGGGPAVYGTILCAPILLAGTGDEKVPAGSAFPYGTLDITCTRPNVFEFDDFAWAEAAAALFGDFYSAYFDREAELVQKALPPNSGASAVRAPAKEIRPVKRGKK